MLSLSFVTVFKSCCEVLVSHSIDIPIGFTKVPNLGNCFGYKCIWTQMTAKLFFLCITWNVICVTSIKNGTIPRDPSEVSRISMSDTTPNWNLQPKLKKMLHGSWNIQTCIMPFKTPGPETTYNRNYYLLCHLVFFKIIETIFASKIEVVKYLDLEFIWFEGKRS